MGEPGVPNGFRKDEDNLKRASICYQRGVEAMERQDWNDASEKFAISVELCPDKLNFRQLLRNCVCKQHRDNKAGAGGIAAARLTGIYAGVRKAMAAEDWPRADRLCEQGLVISPWDVFLNANLGRVARRRGFLEVAQFCLNFALGLQPKSDSIHLELMEILRERGEQEEADRIQEFLDRLDDEPDQDPGG